ncbi:MAG TPA: phage minor head protein, partial [Cellvibrionaceae bacterium]
AGRNPRTTALDLVGRIDPLNRQRTGGYIGMTSNQAQWVENARSELESLNPNYLTRQLRDKRFDSAVRKAIESGEPLKADQIDRAITQMQSRTLKYRGDVIARTESINALRAGQHESFAQAINNGEVDVGDAKRTWDATGGPRTRDAHMAMEGQERDWGVPFDGPDGSQLLFPGDSSLGAPAAMTIQCRCRERTEIDYAGKLKRLEGFA